MDVLVQHHPDRVVVTLNRPQRLNAITDGLVREMSAALAAVPEPRSDDGPRVVVIRGAGRAFSSGHDLKEPVPVETEDEARARLERLQDLTRLMVGCPVPVVAAVHGWAVGAGAEIALAADLVVAETTARFTLPEVGVGLAVTNGISRVLAPALGPQRAKRVMFLGEPMTAEELHTAGLVSHLTEPGTLDAAVSDLVAALAAQPPVALTWAKRLLDAGAGADLETALSAEVEASLRLSPAERRGLRGSGTDGSA